MTRKTLSIIEVAALFISLGLVTIASELDKGKDPNNFMGMPLVYSSDFAQGAEEWQPMDPKVWKVIEDGGTKVLASLEDSDYTPDVRSPQNIAVLKDLEVSDFVIEAKLKSTQPAYNHRDMCILFGYQDPSHYYYAHIAPAPNTDPNANSIFLVNGEPRKTIADKRNNGTQWKDDTYHTVVVVRDTKSGSIKVYFDDLDTPILEASDKTFEFGRVGVGSFDDTGNVASFKVWGVKK